MKKIQVIIAITAFSLFTACQNEEDVLQDSGVGYLRLEVGADKTTITKAEEIYNPKQIAVKIINEAGETIEETDDYTTWTDAIALTPGKYKISASSAGFDGTTAAWDKPYYAGLDSVTIVKGESVSKTVTCTLANVLVTVEFDSEFKKAFKSATVVVTDTVTASNKVTFTMNETTEKGKAYFPVTGLFADLAVTNQKDKIFSKKDTVEDVKARENVILRYKLGESSTGSTNIDITLDGTTKTYIYTIGVPLTATSTIVASGANAWSSFAYLNAEIPSFAGIFDSSKLFFEYKTAEASEWIKVETEKTVIEKNKKYSIKLSSLTPATAYQYRLFYDDGTEKGIVSDVVDFTTEDNIIPDYFNLSFDDWYTTGGKNNVYACSSANYPDKKFWDSGNEGANTINEINPTKQETKDVVEGSAARLTSTEVNAYIFKVFAAGSLYSGDFLESVVGGLKPEDSGAKLSFGQPYSAGRPTRLTGYYKYNPVNVTTYTSSKVPQVKSGDRDSCSIYIALTDWTTAFEVNTKESKFVDFTDNSIIAYGELSKEEMSPESMAEYKAFSIDLKYRDLNRKPTYILIVCSSSKYGDYFVGGVGSTLLVDEFSLEFGEPIIDENYINK